MTSARSNQFRGSAGAADSNNYQEDGFSLDEEPDVQSVSKTSNQNYEFERNKWERVDDDLQVEDRSVDVLN